MSERFLQNNTKASKSDEHYCPTTLWPDAASCLHHYYIIVCLHQSASGPWSSLSRWHGTRRWVLEPMRGNSGGRSSRPLSRHSSPRCSTERIKWWDLNSVRIRGKIVKNRVTPALSCETWSKEQELSCWILTQSNVGEAAKDTVRPRWRHFFSCGTRACA